MCRHHVKKSGQVTLELVIVFVGLALLGIFSTQLFAHLNLGSVHRLDAYRDSRLDAVNNPSRLAGIVVPTTLNSNAPLSNPLTFLDYFPSTNITIPTSPIQAGIDLTLYEDPRVNEASLLLEEQDLITDLVLPYKISQADYLVSLINWNAFQWEPAGYIEKIKGLVNESIDLANRFYNDFSNAIDLYQDVLNNPIVPGQFDPDVMGNALLYGLDPNIDTSQIESLQKEHTLNRENLQSTVNSLESALPGLDTFRNLLIYGQGPFLGLNYVAQYIGDFSCFEYLCYPSDKHFQAISTLKEVAGYAGGVSPALLDSGLAQKINQLYSLLASNPGYAEVTTAKDLAAEILGSNQGEESSTLADVIADLDQTLDFSLKYWDNETYRDYYLDLSQIQSWALAEVAELQL